MKVIMSKMNHEIVEKSAEELAIYASDRLLSEKVVDLSFALKGTDKEKLYGVKSFTVFHEDEDLNPEYLGTGCYDDPMTNIMSLANASREEVQEFLLQFFRIFPEEATIEVSVA